ncbi:unnamed protein product [Thelazia callipaeda]|uniref:non-specific serine/threonine protein kinase n=1 Tax=Thelazia callipaeda TaxID=103827 RepID=A0A0N5D7A4_THECL|nr:unnamed protein product [Thelazia callipaeda]
MPLSLFGRGTGNVKSQQLEHPSRVVKLPCHTVTLEKKLAEGGFAIVYLASDKQGHQYALKRQFISDDVRQLEACRRECPGHKNIISYVDHMILKNNCGVYECSLLTAFYKNSVLQLMNERHLAGRCLSAKEILKIFCDVCEAVARLHHSQTPVIHRDLKTENVLIDERQRDSPVYVLCDFGSATTKVLSSETQSLQFIEEEIHRYTTLGYRAPEMVDIYSGKTIGTKIDIWALGVMLYRLCYFSLPFGESSLAIQNCSYSFPTEPNYPEELRAIISNLFIYLTKFVIFSGSKMIRRSCDDFVELNKVAPLRVVDVIQSFRQQEDIVMKEEATSSRTSAFANFDNFVAPKEVATSINPRLRPKPYGNVACLNLVDSSSRLLDVKLILQ